MHHSDSRVPDEPGLSELYNIEFDQSVTVLTPKPGSSADQEWRDASAGYDLSELISNLYKLVRTGEITPIVRTQTFKAGSMDLHVFSEDFAVSVSRHLVADENYELITQASRHCILRMRLQGDVEEGWEGHSRDEHNASGTFLNYESGITHVLRFAPGRPFNSVSIIFEPSALDRFFAPTSVNTPALLKAAGETEEPSAHLIPLTMTAELIEYAQRFIDLPQDDPLYPLAAEVLSKTILMEALRTLDAGTAKAQEGLRLRASEIQQLTNTKIRIESEYAEKLTIDELSRWSGLNKNKLNDGFKALFDIGVHDFVLSCRMSGAKKLLAEGLPVEEVAAGVGYSGRSGLLKAMKRYYGVAPRDLV